MGKSNVLDALLFALTQDVSLRSRNWGELRTRSQRGPCAVALRIQPPASSETISIVAHVKDDATRLLKLNDKQATVSQVRTALRQARLEAEDTPAAGRHSGSLRQRRQLRAAGGGGVPAVVAGLEAPVSARPSRRGRPWAAARPRCARAPRGALLLRAEIARARDLGLERRAERKENSWRAGRSTHPEGAGCPPWCLLRSSRDALHRSARQ